MRAVAGKASQDQIMYGIAGERHLLEWEVPWPAGYRGSKPVRIGNTAATQLQLDVYGEVADALHHVCQHGFNATVGTFVQTHGSTALDASLLLIPLVGFLPASDPRVVATVEGIERKLTVDGFERLLGACNDLGLLAEEYDPPSRRLLGNFPQAFSHIGLVNSAVSLSRAIAPLSQRIDDQHSDVAA